MKFGKDLSVYAISDLLGKSIGIISSPLLTRFLTPDQFGAYPLLIGVWSILQWIQYSGMETSFQFYRAQRLDEESRREILSTCTYIAVFSVIMVWFLFCAIELLTGWLQSYARISQLETWAFLVGLGPMGLVGWHLIVLRFSHQSLSFSRLNLISRVLGPGLASVIIALFAQNDRLLIFLMTISFAQMVSIYFSFREMKRHPMSPYERKFFSARLGKEMTSYGLLVVPGAVLYSLVTLVDRLMLGWLSGNEQVALFALASTIAAVALTLKTWFSLVYNPHVIDWIATKDPSIYLPRLQNIVSFVSLIFFPIAVLACFWSRPVIGWIYPDFYLQAANLIPWIALSCAFSMVSMVAIVTNFVTRSPRWYFVVNALALACNCAVGWILIPQYGAKGAVIGAALAEFSIMLMWICIGHYRKNLELRWSLALGICAISMMAVIFLTEGYVSVGDHMPENIAGTALILGLALAGLYLVRPNEGWKMALLK